MKKAIIFTSILGILAAVVFLAACTGSTQPVNNSAATGAEANSNTATAAKTFTITFASSPDEIQAGTPAELTFTIKDNQGAVVKDLQIVHEKPMHVLVVSKDLSEFYHIHPEQSAPDGSYRVSHTFPNGGDYKIYVDFTPRDAEQIVQQIDVKVAGAERPAIALQVDKKLENTVDGLKVVMKPSAEIKAGEPLTLDFQVFDATSGKPATDLQNYLGELAHFVIISEDLKDFVHAHPMSKGESMDGMSMGEAKPDRKSDGAHSHSETGETQSTGGQSEVSAHTTFPRTGLYKVWAQFQRNNKVIAVPFVVKVAGAEAKIAKNDANIPAGALKVSISSTGFEPAAFSVKKGGPVKLAFVRNDANNCASEIVFPALKIKKELPVGEMVVVEFTPQNSGDIAFSCGMGMMKGKVIVN